MKKTLLLVCASALFANSFALTIAAGNNYVIEDQNGHTYQDGSTSGFMNFGVNGIYKSLAVIDFDGSALAPNTGIASASLTLQESDYTGTKPFTAPLKVWAVTDNTTDLTKANNTTIGYDDATLGGYSGQLGTATLLGSFSFTSTSSTSAPYPLDTVNLTTGLTAVKNLINSSNHVIRLVITTDETGYATFFSSKSSNSTNATYGDARPQLTVNPVPEPCSMAILGIGLVGLVSRRRRS